MSDYTPYISWLGHFDIIQNFFNLLSLCIMVQKVKSLSSIVPKYPPLTKFSSLKAQSDKSAIAIVATAVLIVAISIAAFTILTVLTAEGLVTVGIEV